MAVEHSELVESLESEWRDSLCSHDIDRLRALIHPDFRMVGTHSAGPFTLTRDEWLEAVQKRKVVGIEVTIKDAIAFDNVMVGTIEARWHVSYLGQTLDDSVIMTDVWIYDEGRWRVIRRHLSPIPVQSPLHH